MKIYNTLLFLLLSFFSFLNISIVLAGNDLNIEVLQLKPNPANVRENLNELKKEFLKADKIGTDLIVTPELFLSGYGLRDFYRRPEELINATEKALRELKKLTQSSETAILVGHIVENTSKGKPLFNSASLIYKGEIIKQVHKTLMPTYDVFEDYRFFEPSNKKPSTIRFKDIELAIAICEDWWANTTQANGQEGYKSNPVKAFQKLKPDLAISLSSSPAGLGKVSRRFDVHKDVAKKIDAPFIYVNEVQTYDNIVTDGYSFVLDRNGEIIGHAKGFEKDNLTFQYSKDSKAIKALHARKINHDLFSSTANILSFSKALLNKADLDYIIDTQIHFLKNYAESTGHNKAIIGLSGGIDSALSTAIAVKALGPENVHIFAMPGPYSDQKSEDFARNQARVLKVPEKNFQVKSIVPAYEAMLKVNPEFVGNVAEENIQSSLRANILLRQSNVINRSFVMSNGNRAEMLTGYFTIGGDNEGGVNILMDLYKMEVYAVAKRLNERFGPMIPQEIIDREPSAELAAGQLDSKELPPYPILDSILRDYSEKLMNPDELAKEYTNLIPEKAQNDLAWVYKLIAQVRRAEFKRRQSGIGLSLRDFALDMNAWRYLIMSKVHQNIPDEQYIRNLLLNKGSKDCDKFF